MKIKNSIFICQLLLFAACINAEPERGTREKTMQVLHKTLQVFYGIGAFFASIASVKDNSHSEEITKTIKNEMSESIKKVIEISSASAQATSEGFVNLNKNVVKHNELMDEANKINKNMKSNLTDINSNLEDLNKIEKARLGAEIIIAGVAVTATGYFLVMKVESYFWPSEIEKYKQAKAIGKFKCQEIVSNLNSCLRKHAEDEKDHEGVPVACVDTFNTFAQILGHQAANEAKNEFKKFYNLN